MINHGFLWIKLPPKIKLWKDCGTKWVILNDMECSICILVKGVRKIILGKKNLAKLVDKAISGITQVCDLLP